MYGTRDRIFFVSGSARFHRHGEQWHERLPMMKDGRAGHSGLAGRPILNELNVIVAEGAEKGSKVIVYSSEEPATKLLNFGRKSGRIQRRTPGSGMTVRGTG